MKLVGFVSAFFVVAFIFGVISACSVLANAPFVPTFEVVPAPTGGGIRLEVPRKFHERFERWKSELLSTEFGRNQWESWATNKNFKNSRWRVGKRFKDTRRIVRTLTR